MPRVPDAKSLRRSNPAESGGVCRGLACDLHDQPFLPLRKEMFAFRSPIQLMARAMCRQ